MYSNLFSAQSVQDLMAVLPTLPFAIWETFYMTVLSTALALVIGLPLGVLLVVGEKGGVLPLPRWLMQVLNVIINLLRSVPFLILMIMVFPLSRLLIGTTIGTTATIWWRPACARWTATSSRPPRAWAPPPCRSSAK
mgnify:CR=1 FL=1